MTREFVLADKLRNQFYVREEIMRVSASSRGRGGRRDVRRSRTRISRSGIREISPRVDPRRITPDGEVRVKKQRINPLFAAALVVMTLMMMALVMSFSQVYQTTSDVSKLERQLENLTAQKEDLAFRLEERNDIRTIETIATAKLGMVKEDTIQRRYVSLSEGEHIVISEATEQTEQSTGGVMLSSLLSTIGKFFDNFR